MVFSRGNFLMSSFDISKVPEFDGAIYPIAFVPDWQNHADFVERRGSLTYREVQGALIPLPDYDDIRSDYNSKFTWLTVYMGRYLDETRQVGAGSHA